MPPNEIGNIFVLLSAQSTAVSVAVSLAENAN